MGGYKPTQISAFETGLVQEREDFILADDAFPVLENAYVWREKVRRKNGKKLIARLRRLYSAITYFNTGASPWTFQLFDIAGGISAITTGALTTITTFVPHGLTTTDTVVFNNVGGTTSLNGNIYAVTVLTTTTFTVPQLSAVAFTGGGSWHSQNANSGEADATLECGTFEMVIAGETITDDGAGNLTGTVSATGTINYLTGAVSLTSAHLAGVATTLTYAYFPGLPVMGLRTRELPGINAEQSVAFDTRYEYRLVSNAWQEFVPGQKWRGNNSDFFWSVNYWHDASNNTLMWATNFTSGSAGDPMRYFNGTLWTTFAPIINTGNSLFQAEILIPFRGRLYALNTYEGTTVGGLAGATNFPNRIRASQIGTPIAADSWLTDERGKGLFLDIPTVEHIITAGFVRDNLVIYCERSTWQLRYTGRSISPVQIEKVNTELGAESTFSAINFDTSLLGIGDKRIVSCDSFKSEPIDEKIPDFAINIENENNGHKRVYGIRNIPIRLVYWTYTSSDSDKVSQGVYPDKRLVYNYENNSWAIFEDSLTVLGNLWLADDATWNDFADVTWAEKEGTWIGKQENQPVIIGGNQQGYVHTLDELNSEDVSLHITDVTGNTPAATTVTSPSHNLKDGDIIYISDIPTGTPFASTLNGNVFMVDDCTADTVDLYTFNSAVDEWTVPQAEADATYIGCGQMRVRYNFRILTKKFSHLEEGQATQMGYVDVLMTATDAGEIALKVYADYDDTAVNNGDDTFFNVVIPTSQSTFDIPEASRYWHRAFCVVRGNFIQLEFTLSNAQMNSDVALNEVDIHAVVLWERAAGRQTI